MIGQNRKVGEEGMTLKEFSIKYEVPYNLVYDSSYGVKPVSTLRRDRDFPEKDLYQSVVQNINRRIKRHEAKALVLRQLRTNVLSKGEDNECNPTH